jgi:hypothetical protein
MAERWLREGLRRRLRECLNGFVKGLGFGCGNPGFRP